MKRIFNQSFLIMGMFLVVAGCATMQTSWEYARSQDTIAAYKEFMKKYPESSHSGEINLRLMTLITEYLKNVKEINIVIEDSASNMSHMGNAIKIKDMLADIMKKKGYLIREGNIPNKLYLTYSEVKAFSGTSSSYWHPTISYELILTFTHERYEKLFSNSYSNEATYWRKLDFPGLGIAPLSPTNKTYMRPTEESPHTPGYWGYGVHFLLAKPGDENPYQKIHQEFLNYNWNGLYSFKEFKGYLHNQLEHKPPLHIYDDSKMLY